MFTRKSFAAAFAISFLMLGATHAQTPTFGVEVNATTIGYVGGADTDDQTIPGGQAAGAAVDPQGSLYHNGYGMVYGDVAASAAAYTQLLVGEVYALAENHSATAFGNASPMASTKSVYYDSFVVLSSSVPNGTLVELVFRNDVSTDWHEPDVPYTGKVYSELQVGGYSASTTSKRDSTWGDKLLPGPEIKVKLKVGSRYSLRSILRVSGQAFYFTPGPIFTGKIHILATSEVQMDSLGQDVWLAYDSGSAN